MQSSSINFWDVIDVDGKRTDSVQFDGDMDANQVRRSLIDHDGYSPNITVVRDFGQALDRFVAAAQVLVNARFAGHTNSAQTLELDPGKRYVRIVARNYYNGARDASGSVYCFVDIPTGNVLKAAGWKAPAKGVRSNIYDADSGVSGVDAYGAKYAR